MLKVILIDDDVVQSKLLADTLERYLKFEQLDALIALVTTSPEQVLEYVKNDPSASYLFLIDIELKPGKYLGIELARKLRQLLPYENIVFLTSHTKFSLTVLEHRIKPLDYIVKNSDMEVMLRSLRKDILFALKQNEYATPEDKETFTYRLGQRYYRIEIADILFFESIPNQANTIVMHAKNQVVEFNGSLKAIENNKLANFFRCHKSYLINLANIYTFDRKRALVYFDAKATIGCKVSFRKARELVKILKK
ncbi:MAG: LytTR family DNA-binding domain-containing protein [Lactobacillus sp.]|nr:LytTR family DNA-binding domain-containing protein [Lactobacillus sp.]